MTHLFTAGLSIGQDDLGQQTLALLKSLTADDDLWVLGTSAPSAPEALDLLPFSTISARLHLVRGEHDLETPVSSPIWSSIDPMKEITVAGQLIVLSYFPLMAWRGAQDDTGVTLGSLHVFGHGGNAHPGWWRAVNVGWDLWQGRFATLSAIRQRSEETFFATPFLESVYPARRRITRCETCYEPMDRGARGGCYHWQNGAIVTFRGEAAGAVIGIRYDDVPAALRASFDEFMNGHARRRAARYGRLRSSGR
jgi:calcineurin-like phosphoesterase family protein